MWMGMGMGMRITRKRWERNKTKMEVGDGDLRTSYINEELYQLYFTRSFVHSVKPLLFATKQSRRVLGRFFLGSCNGSSRCRRNVQCAMCKVQGARCRGGSFWGNPALKHTK